MRPRFQKLEDRVSPGLLLGGPSPGSAWSPLCGLGKVPSPLWACFLAVQGNLGMDGSRGHRSSALLEK